MAERIWKLRSKGRGSPGIGESAYTTEAGFTAALRDAWRAFATEISATLPDGTHLSDSALRARYIAS
jgi:hypothetical protein